MAEEANFGVRRLRQAITNQATCGSGQFELSIDSADKLCREVEDELTRLSWAAGVPTPKDADGKVVPLTTGAMYDKNGEEVKISRFSLTNDGFEQNRRVWNAMVMTGFIANLEDLHLHLPDSWERLEEDVARIGSDNYPCDYFNHHDCGMPCYSCPAHTDAEDCTAELARDVLRRAKALAERDAKEA